MPEHPFDRYAGFTDLAALKEFSARPLRKSVRVNLLKTTTDAFRTRAAARGWQLTPVPWCAEAFYVDREDRSVALGKDLLHLLGHLYMQEAASMLPVALLQPQPGETILDMSAAPGSKTTQIASHLGNTGVIVANDVQEKRLWTLKSAVHRAGVLNVIVTKKVGQWFAKHMTERFDRVLCDAPCTAQGTIRKDSDALDFCSLENIGIMAKLQRELLESAVHAAKVGGRIVYSTCTLAPEENEAVVRSILEKFPGAVEAVDPRTLPGLEGAGLEQGILDSFRVQEGFGEGEPLPLIRLWPQTYDTEGFFCAVLKKTAPTRPRERMEFVRFQEDELPQQRREKMMQVLEGQFGYPFVEENERLFERGEHLLLATREVADFRMPVQDYALGLPFAKRLDDDRLRIEHEAVALRGDKATRNVCAIDDAQLATLLDGKDTTCAPDLRGDCVMLHHGMPVGVGLARDGHLKNRLPRWVVVKS